LYTVVPLLCSICVEIFHILDCALAGIKSPLAVCLAILGPFARHHTGSGKVNASIAVVNN